MRTYKCALCKSAINTNTLYEHTVISQSGKIIKKRYCNYEEFESYQKEVKFRKLIFDEMFNLMGYSEKQILPTLVNKKIAELYGGYTYEIIYQTFLESRETIKYWCSLDGKFDKEYQKVSYIFAIIINSINDVYKRYEREKQLNIQDDKQHIEMDIFDAMPIVNTNKKDISLFLD